MGNRVLLNFFENMPGKYYPVLFITLRPYPDLNVRPLNHLNKD